MSPPGESTSITSLATPRVFASSAPGLGVPTVSGWLTIPSGCSPPISVAVDTQYSEAFVAYSGGSCVEIYSAQNLTPIAEVSTGYFAAASDLAYDRARGDIFVADPAQNKVLVLNDTHRDVIARVLVGSSPTRLAVDPDIGRVFVSDSQGRNLSVISDSNFTAVGSVPVGNQPGGIVYDPVHRQILASTGNLPWGIAQVNASTRHVRGYLPGAVVNGGALALDTNSSELVGVQSNYGAVAFNLSNGSVAGTFFNHSSVFDLVSLPDLGLFAASEPSADLIEFLRVHGTVPVANLSLGFSPGALGYLPSAEILLVSNPDNGSIAEISVSGYHRVHFVESGLPAGAVWGVRLEGRNVSGSGPTITVVSPEGSFPYSVWNSRGYVGPKGPGNLTVGTQDLSVPIYFSVRYLVTIETTGIPAGVPWGLNVSTTPVPTVFQAGGLNASIYLFNGSYNFSVWTEWIVPHQIRPASGRFSVTGQSVTIRITFIPLYAVEFLESGLPAGLGWSVDFNGSSTATNATAVYYEEPNSTGLSYQISGPIGYTSIPSSGRFPVDGSPIVVSIDFSVSGSGPGGVGSGPRILELTATPDPAFVGRVVTFAVTIVGGIAPISTDFSGAPGQCQPPAAFELSCWPTSVGSYRISAEVVDSLGRTDVRNLSLNVTSGAPVLAGPDTSEQPTLLAWTMWTAGAAAVAVVAFLVLRKSAPRSGSRR